MQIKFYVGVLELVSIWCFDEGFLIGYFDGGGLEMGFDERFDGMVLEMGVDERVG